MDLPAQWYIKTTEEVIPVLQQTDLSFEVGYDYTIGGYYSNNRIGRSNSKDFEVEYGGTWYEITLDDLLQFLNQSKEPNYEIY